MTLSIGTRLGPYEILSAIGAGGMGEVYRARDTKLGRDVALKMLPQSFTHDLERVARFEREAQILASLNHAHIGAIYGLEESNGVQALVLELVEGSTLADRVAQGPVPLDEALALAGQIAEALEAAHDHGIIHRDLKPANIKITPDGIVKVLDFGLAKAAAAADASALTHSPTMVGATSDGTLLGTAPYMSPEQARGKPVDKRADIWAFGCVLYELLVGRRAFAGETASDAIAAVLERRPDWNALPSFTPPSIRRLLERCLEKDARQRQRDIGDVRIDINDALAGGPVAASPVRARRGVGAFVLVGLAVGVFGGVAGVWSLRRQPDSALGVSRVRRLTIRTLPGAGWSEADFLGALRGSRSVAVSPDGSRVVYVGIGQGSSRLYLRSLDQPDARPLDGTGGASAPFWSPDGQWVAFFSSGKLRKVPVGGGPSKAVCDAPDDTGGSGGSWGPDGTIVFAKPVSDRAGLMRVSADGGTPAVLTTPDAREGGGHGDPAFTPDGRAVLFTTRQTLGTFTPSIMVRSLVTGEQRKLIDGTNRPLNTGSGHLLFARGATLFAVGFDAAQLRTVGIPVPVQDGVLAGQFDVSADGLLAYIAEPRVAGRSLMWVDRAGAAVPALPEQRGFGRPRLSPDGRRIVVEVVRDTNDPAPQTGNSDIWVYLFENGVFTKLTNTGRSNSPFWTPDGNRIAFRTGSSIVWQAADGSGSVESLMEPTDPALKTGNSVAPGAWSPDGHTLAFVVHTSVSNGADIWALHLGAKRMVTPLIQRPGDQWSVRVSPDGRWVSYASNESGRFEVYVEPLAGGARHQVSTDGGEEPVWSPKGDELFYRVGDRMLATAVNGTGTSFAADRPHLLFRGRYVATDLAAYDVARDGKRFLMVRPDDDELRPAEISVVENWFEEVKRLAPAKP